MLTNILIGWNFPNPKWPKSQSYSCNSNALTDLASAAELSGSAVKIASMNVRINLDFIEGEDVDVLSKSLDVVVGESSTKLESIRSNVSERLGWK